MTPAERDERVVSDRADLEQADRHIREAEGRIARQEELIREFIADGCDPEPAEALLATFREVLRGFLDHRALIVAGLERLAAEATVGDTA